MNWKKERPVMFQCSHCKIVWIVQLKSTEQIGNWQKGQCAYCKCYGTVKYIWAFKNPVGVV